MEIPGVYEAFLRRLARAPMRSRTTTCDAFFPPPPRASRSALGGLSASGVEDSDPGGVRAGIIKIQTPEDCPENHLRSAPRLLPSRDPRSLPDSALQHDGTCNGGGLS